jgi:hypothetical protein
MLSVLRKGSHQIPRRPLSGISLIPISVEEGMTVELASCPQTFISGERWLPRSHWQKCQNTRLPFSGASVRQA